MLCSLWLNKQNLHWLRRRNERVALFKQRLDALRSVSALRFAVSHVLKHCGAPERWSSLVLRWAALCGVVRTGFMSSPYGNRKVARCLAQRHRGSHVAKGGGICHVFRVCNGWRSSLALAAQQCSGGGAYLGNGDNMEFRQLIRHQASQRILFFRTPCARCRGQVG